MAISITIHGQSIETFGCQFLCIYFVIIAGLDVFEKEPLPKNSPLIELEDIVLTPHIAFLSEESIDECTYICVENVRMFVDGKPQNVVNPSVIADREVQR